MASNTFIRNTAPKRPNYLQGTEELLGNQQIPAGQFDFAQPKAPPAQPQAQPTMQDYSLPTGQGGKVNSLLTGKKTNQPRAYADALAVLGPQEAMNFSFNNLPTAGIDASVQGLLGAGQQAGRDREAALAEVKAMQARALAPNLDPETRRFFQDMADQRRAEVESEFAVGGGIANQFERLGASNIASLANRGVIDSTTGAQTMARQNVDLAALRNQLLNQASEQSRQDVLAERTGIRGAATEFGSLQGQLANAAGQLQQYGLGTAGELGLKNRDLEAQLQLAEVGQRLLGSQTALENIQSLRNNRFNRVQAREQAALQQKLIKELLGGNGLWGTLGTLAGTGIGAAFGGPAGATAGAQIGGQLGRSF